MCRNYNLDDEEFWEEVEEELSTDEAYKLLYIPKFTIPDMDSINTNMQLVEFKFDRDIKQPSKDYLDEF